MSDTHSDFSDAWTHVSQAFSDGGPESAAFETPAAAASASPASSAHALSPEAPGDESLAAPPSLPMADPENEDAAGSAPAGQHASGAADGPAVGDAASDERSDQLDRVCSDRWDSTDRVMDALRLADSAHPRVPLEMVTKRFNVLVLGCEQTGKTSTIQTIFAPIAGDPNWVPNAPPRLDAEAFGRDFAPVDTVVRTTDESKRMEIVYRIMESPGLTASAPVCVEAITKWIKQQDDDYAAQERDPSIAPESYVDKRVSLVLYFLPDVNRLSDFDAQVMGAVFKLKPGIPIMFRGDAFNEGMLRELKADFQRHVGAGRLQPYQPSAEVLASLHDALRGCSRSLAREGGAPVMQLPWNTIAGDEVDEAVSSYRHIRTNGVGSINVYSSESSDIPAVRRLITENGFLEILRLADACFRASHAARAASDAPAPAPVRAPAPAPAPVAARHQGTQASSPPPAAPPAPAPAAVPVFDLLGLSGPPANIAHAPAAAAAAAAARVPNVAAAVAIGSRPPSLTSDDSSDTPPPFSPRSDDGNPPALAEVQFDEAQYDRVVVREVEERGSGGTMRVTIERQGGDRVILIRVSDAEGGGMRDAMNGRVLARPNTHDTYGDMLRACGAKVVRVLIVECSHTVFHARVHVSCPGRGTFSVDARPSSAINMALRSRAADGSGAPVFVHKAVMTQYGKSSRR